MGFELTPEDYSLYKEVMREFGLSEYTEIIQPHLEKRLDYAYTEIDDYSDIGNNRLGGWPDLPEEIDWPTDEKGRFLLFIFQLDLSKIAHPLLPRSGTLFFFFGGVDWEEEGKIIFYDGPRENMKKRIVKAPLHFDNFSWGFFDDYNGGWNDGEWDQYLFDTPYRVTHSYCLTMPLSATKIKVNGKLTPINSLLSREQRNNYFAAESYCEDLSSTDLHIEPQVAISLFGNIFFEEIDPRYMGVVIKNEPPQGVNLLTLIGSTLGFLVHLDRPYTFNIGKQDLINKEFSHSVMKRR